MNFRIYSLSALFIFLFIAVTVVDSSKRKKIGYSLGGASRYAVGSALSKHKKKLLFAGAGALAGLYIGYKMRPRIHSYSDISDYEVCVGQPRLTESITRKYEYFLCPDDPFESYRRYCCWDSLSNSGICCSYQQKYYGSTRRVSNWVGIVVVVVVITMVILFVYCYRRRRRNGMNEPQVYVPPIIPTNNVSTPYPDQNTLPYPVVQPPPTQNNVTNQIGSAWAQQPTTFATDVPKYPPPPYYQ